MELINLISSNINNEIQIKVNVLIVINLEGNFFGSVFKT
jgi:hypothetical protein